VNTSITDAWLARLTGQKRCRVTVVSDTKVTPDEAAAMKRKFPWMIMVW